MFVEVGDEGDCGDDQKEYFDGEFNFVFEFYDVFCVKEVVVVWYYQRWRWLEGVYGDCGNCDGFY